MAVITGGAVRWLHDNGVHSTGFVTDAAGARIGAIEPHPFGNTASASGDLDFRTFSLHPIDAESGLVYMRRRYYAPSLGRFLTPDLMAIYQPEKFRHRPADHPDVGLTTGAAGRSSTRAGERTRELLSHVAGSIASCHERVVLVCTRSSRAVDSADAAHAFQADLEILTPGPCNPARGSDRPPSRRS